MKYGRAWLDFGERHELGGFRAELDGAVAHTADAFEACRTWGWSSYELVQDFQRARRKTGEYVAGGWDKPAATTVWNTHLVPASSIPQSTARVLDTTWLKVLDRQEVTVLVCDRHEKN